MIRVVVNLAIAIVIVVFATQVPLGQHTLWGHLQRIWQAEETQELVDEVKTQSGPVVEKLKRGVQAGYEEITKGDGGPVDAAVDSGDAGHSSDGGVSPSLVDKARGAAAEELGERAGDMVEKAVEDEVGGAR